MKKEKNINYYLSLPYKIEIEQIPSEDGGGYTARLPQFGAMGIVGDGETIPEAIDSLNNIKTYIFEMLIKERAKIPEPESDISKYSGKLLLRIPKELHARITTDARTNGTSINQYVTYLLSSSSYTAYNDILNTIETKIETCIQNISHTIYTKIQINFEEQIDNNIQSYTLDFNKAA
ncbi:MAG: toxin-antitoxin system HicB family antitoxin [Desulfobacterales bacterium]|nr:toxin-antitoxin system HicB family antitoxin [Desulfobacterales bacterium]